MFSGCSVSIHENKHRLESFVILPTYQPQQLPVVRILQNLSRIQSLLTCFAMSSRNPPPSVSLPFALCLCYPSIMRLLELICLNVFLETYPVLPDLPGFPAVLRRAKLFFVLFKPDALWSGLLPFLFWTVWPCFVPHTHLTIATLFLFFQPLEQAFSQHPGVASFINVQVSPQVSPSPLSYLKLQFILSLSSYFLHSPHSYFPSFGLPPLISTLTVYLRGWQIGVGQIKLLALHVKFCWHIAWSICL